jgi:hypothetical protein
MLTNGSRERALVSAKATGDGLLRRCAPRNDGAGINYIKIELFSSIASGVATSVNLGFLGAWPFGCEPPIDRYWILLDFLGFSRPNRELSMGYTGFSEQHFSRAFSPWR